MTPTPEKSCEARKFKTSESRRKVCIKSIRKWNKKNRSKKLAQDRRNFRIRTKLGLHKVDPIKYKARQALRNAVASGLVVKPKKCSDCGKVKLLGGHHNDYSKPFDVKWLCASCHGKEHRKWA